MLGSSATETGRSIDLRAIVDGAVDPGIVAGRELIDLARTCTQTTPDRTALDAVAVVIGTPAAVDAAAVSANFQIMNRVVDATGLPIGKKRRSDAADMIADLDLDSFPHAAH